MSYFRIHVVSLSSNQMSFSIFRLEAQVTKQRQISSSAVSEGTSVAVIMPCTMTIDIYATYLTRQHIIVKAMLVLKIGSWSTIICRGGNLHVSHIDIIVAQDMFPNK